MGKTFKTSEEAKNELEAYICDLQNQYNFLNDFVSNNEPKRLELEERLNFLESEIKSKKEDFDNYINIQKSILEDISKQTKEEIKKKKESIKLYETNILKDLDTKKSELEAFEIELKTKETELTSSIKSNEAIITKTNEDMLIIAQKESMFDDLIVEIDEKSANLSKINDEAIENLKLLDIEKSNNEKTKEELIKVSDKLTSKEIELNKKEEDLSIKEKTFTDMIELEKETLIREREELNILKASLMEEKNDMIIREKNISDKENALDAKQEEIDMARAKIVKYENEQKFKFLTQ